MTAAQNQDFVTYNGDTVSPIFTVQDANGNPVDISGAIDISWFAQRNVNDVIAVTKHKSTGGISFVTTGTDGKFQVAITPSDTSGLTGWYTHFATVSNASGPTTVEAGRMMVGPSPNWTYDDGSAATEDIYLVRDMIGDTIQSDQLLSDRTIFLVLNRYNVIELAAAECSRFIASKYARQVDTVVGEMKTNYSQRRKAYMAQAMDLEQRGMSRGGVVAYAGGISTQDKMNTALDTDRVPPNFVIAMFDNTLPEWPVGHQTNVTASPDSSSDLGIQLGTTV